MRANVGAVSEGFTGVKSGSLTPYDSELRRGEPAFARFKSYALSTC